jgi:AraC family transcriptional regulator
VVALGFAGSPLRRPFESICTTLELLLAWPLGAKSDMVAWSVFRINPMTIKLAPGSFYGETKRGRQVSGFTLAESVYPHPLRIPPHSHARPFLYLVLEGVCKETCSNWTQNWRPSTLVFHPAGNIHSNQWLGASGRSFHIEVGESRMEQIRQYTAVLDHPTYLEGGLAPWLAHRLYREYTRTDDLSPLVLEGLALEVLAEMSRPGVDDIEKGAPGWVLQIRDLLHDQFQARPSLDDISRVVGIHPAHLARVFRKEFGCTIGDFVRRLRVRHACQKLSTSDVPLARIALDAGFSDQSHFTKVFRLHTGMTPAEFRRISGRRKLPPSS